MSGFFMEKQRSLFVSDHENFISSADVCLFTQALQQGALTQEVLEPFKQHIKTYFKLFGRSFAWRQTTSPYQIVVSEIMLQQTQTSRVVGKFEKFIETFPHFEALARAQTRDVIMAWQGLGYNKRALALHALAQRVVQEFSGILPHDPEKLKTFKGIGPNTAGSICAFAFNKPTVFIETNVRSVYIHFFFQGQSEVHDKMLFPLIHMTLDHENPREWYYALMDYGVALKKMYPNPSRNSAHYAVQSKFKGSDRQIRGAVLRALLVDKVQTIQALAHHCNADYMRVERILRDLEKDGFLKLQHDNTVLLSD